jgi:NADH-quinone oxidoreductase subunit G
MPTVYIDDEEYQVKDGINMLEAILSLKLDLPYFCWHPAMHSVGSCRQCAVKVFKDESDTKGKIEMACMIPAAEGARISLNDPEAVEFRRYVIEWLMTNHPHDCPVCDEGGECHLQDMTCMTGHVYRRFRGKKRTYKNQYLGPFVNHEMNRCIQCWRCVRFYRDMAGGRDFNVFGSKNRVYFGRDKDGVLESEFSGNLVEVCPTGVFTDKTLKRHYTRKWDLETAPSVCIHCGLGCNTIPGARYGELRRITARYNSEVNGYFICDRGRFGYEFVNQDVRIRRPRIKDEQEPSSWGESIGHARKLLVNAKRVIGIGSPRASLEANYALKKLVGSESFSTGLSDYDQAGADLALEILRNGMARTPSLAEVQSADVALILGADPNNEAPMLDYSIRRAVDRARLDISRALKIPDWDANAVAEALQGAKGKLYVASPWRIKLDDVATESIRASFVGIADFAADLAEKMHSQIASDLLQARQPLIVTSISAGTDVIKMAANLATALHEKGKDCWLTIISPEANTMGTAMLGGMSVDEALALVESGEADTLVILENDLSRRADIGLLEKAMNKARGVVVLDCIESKTSARADLALPVSAYVEAEGTFVNNEGRAQRYYQVFVPSGEMKPGWRVIQEMAEADWWVTYDDILKEIAGEVPSLAGIIQAAPLADWRSPAGRKVARMPHRFSGRTAIDANWTMNEPKPPDDPDTPFAFTMEGDQNPVPGPLNPRFWWPGWNSVNSVTKFQVEVNGPLEGGNPGKRLIEPTVNGQRNLFPKPDSAVLEPGEVWLIPRLRIFGSDELSRFSPGIVELTPKAEVQLHPETAGKLGLTEGDVLHVRIDSGTLRLPVRFDDQLARDVATVPAGHEVTAGLTSPERVRIGRAR